MSLLTRIAGVPDAGEVRETINRIPIAAFTAFSNEMLAGEFDRTRIVTRYSLNAAEQADLNWLIDGIYYPVVAVEPRVVTILESIFIMGELGEAGYQTDSELRARIERVKTLALGI